MKPLKFFKSLSIVLFVLNLAMIGFFIWRKPPPPKGGGHFLRQAQQMLKLDEQQNEQFVQMAKVHKRKMDSIQQVHSEFLMPWFQSVFNSTSDPNSDLSLDRVGQLEQEKVELTYKHFKEIKSLLNPSQQDRFEPFMNEALKNILGRTKKKPRPPKDF